MLVNSMIKTLVIKLLYNLSVVIKSMVNDEVIIMAQSRCCQGMLCEFWLPMLCDLPKGNNVII